MSRNRSCTLYIKGIPEGCRHEDLRRTFGKFGQLYDVSIPMDYYTGRMKGFAFVEYEDARDAEDAVYRMDRSRFLGREIEVEMARGIRKTPSEMRFRDRMASGRRYGGGYGDGGRSGGGYGGRDGGGYGARDGGGHGGYGGSRRRRSFNSRSRSRTPVQRRRRPSPVIRVSRSRSRSRS